MPRRPTPRPSFADLARTFKSVLVDDVAPFWMKHGVDREHGGMLTAVDRDGSLLDSDKSVWFQGRAGWMFATLHNTIGPNPEWLEAATSCVRFIKAHCIDSTTGKMYFTVTRDGKPLRMRRYVFSESFAAIAFAAHFKATQEAASKADALQAFSVYLHYSFDAGVMAPKFEPTRPCRGIAPHMICIVTAMELRDLVGDEKVNGKTMSEWIDFSIDSIQKYHVKPDMKVVLECVAEDGSLVDHTDGRTLNPGHSIECAWFMMAEGKRRKSKALVDLGCRILEWMWERGWDAKHGGLLYFVDVHGKPVQEYWHDMKFWWPHCEAIIATLMA